MSYAFRITISGIVDGTTVVSIPDPLPAQDADGVVEFTVSAFGILDPGRLRELLGAQGMWLVAAGVTADAGVTAVSLGLVRPSSFTDMQAIYDGVAPADALPIRKGPYIPQGWRLRATAFDAGGLPVAGTHTIYASFQGVGSFLDVCNSGANPLLTTVVAT